MRWNQRRVESAVSVLLIGLIAGCGTSDNGGSGPGERPAIAISISKNSMTIQQGGSDNLVATITRSGGFTGVVTIATEGAPTGATAAVSNVTTAGGTTTGTITVNVASSVPVGTYNLTVRATGAGVDAKTLALTLTVTAAPAISLGLSASTLGLAQGATGNTTVTINRTNYTGTVNLTLEGAPAGVTGLFTPAAVSGTSSTLAISVAATTATGVYDLTVRGAGDGVTAATTGLQLTVTVPAAYTLDASPSPVSVAQGASGQVTVTLVRTNFTGTVNLTLEGAPNGVTPSFNPAAVTGTTSALTLNVAASVTAGDYQLTVRGTAQGLPDRTDGFTLTVTPVAAGDFSLSTTPSGTVSVQQNGASVPVQVNILRTGGFAGSVGLTVTGAPTGLTATLNPTNTTGNSSTLTLSATTAVNIGNLQLTITGSSASPVSPAERAGTVATGPDGGSASRATADRTVSLTVNVTPPPSGGNTTLNYSGCLMDAKPIWLAVQDGIGGTWTRVVGSGDVYSFNVTQPKVGLAVVTGPSGVGTNLTVSYYSLAEIGGIASAQICPPPPTSKQLKATTANLGPTQVANLSLGWGSGAATAALPTANIDGVSNGTFDLVGYATTPGSAGAGDRSLIRRDINTAAIAAGGSIGATLDFTGTLESAAAATAAIAIGNLTGGEGIFHGMFYYTRASCDGGLLYGGANAGTVTSITGYGVPAVQQAPTDYHGIFIQALGTAPNLTVRTVTEYFQPLVARTVNLPTPVPSLTPSVLSGAYKRLRFQFTLPSDLNTSLLLSYTDDDGQAVIISATVAGFLGGSGVDLSVPDFSAVAGWNNSWVPGPTESVQWSALASGGTTTNPCAGGRMVTSTRNGTA